MADRPLTEPVPQRVAGEFSFGPAGTQSETVARIGEPVVQDNPGGDIHGVSYRILAVEPIGRDCDYCHRPHHGTRFYVLNRQQRLGLALCPVCLDRINPMGNRITVSPRDFPELIKALTEPEIMTSRYYNPDNY